MKKPHKRKTDEKRKVSVRAVSVIFSVAVVSCIAIYSLAGHLYQNPSAHPPKAAIVDHLSIYAPNQIFVNKSTEILARAGFTVDYYAWDTINVDFFRNLPAGNYALIVLRVHSAVAKSEPNYLGMFTSERFSETKYPEEWTTGCLGKARLFIEDDKYYFAVTPKFVEKSMKGRFSNTAIIMMGCDGLTHDNMAKAFSRKGAGFYIGWDGPVTINHTDQAAAILLMNLVARNQSVAEATSTTMKEVGMDPTHKSSIIYDPTSAGKNHLRLHASHGRFTMCVSNGTRSPTLNTRWQLSFAHFSLSLSRNRNYFYKFVWRNLVYVVASNSGLYEK